MLDECPISLSSVAIALPLLFLFTTSAGAGARVLSSDGVGASGKELVANLDPTAGVAASRSRGNPRRRRKQGTEEEEEGWMGHGFDLVRVSYVSGL
ncbi:unnamed protein product [Linum trigynum]|uniref:Uncharacterized protein n=1 Tax=Linum trigynum TaxID=586398 RepID=A0AAV2ED51_9ROSI